MYSLSLMCLSLPYQGSQKSVLDVFQRIQINYNNQLGVDKFASWVLRGVNCHSIDTPNTKLVNKCLAFKTPLGLDKLMERGNEPIRI